MNQSELRSYHPVQSKDITPMGAWLLHRAVIGAVFAFTFAPFILYYFQQ